MTKSILHARKSEAGFNLVMLAILLMAGGLVAVAVLPGEETSNYLQLAQETQRRMVKIEEASKGFMTMQGRRPCPADATIDVGSANFGVEGGTQGTCTGGTPSANFSGSGGAANVVAGGVPTVSLGLPDEYAFDAFGHRFTYLVDKRATYFTSCLALQGGETPQNGSYTGDVEFRASSPAGTLDTKTMWALISHGADAHGAFPMQGVSSSGSGLLSGGAAAARINSGSTDTDTRSNGSVDGSFNNAFTQVVVKKEKTSAFDDIAWYAPDTKNSCCLGAVCNITGFVFNGATANTNVGSNTAVGDINGDGYQDFVTRGDNNWNLYVVFGRSSKSLLVNPLTTTTVNGTNGFKINMTWLYYGGISALTVADVNNDGFGDIIFSGTSYMTGVMGIIFGKACGASLPSACSSSYTYTSSTNFTGTSTGVYYFTSETQMAAVGPSGGQWLMGAFMGAGDINGDGYADVAIGAPGANNSGDATQGGGAVYIIYGRANGTSWNTTGASPTSIIAMADGTNGTVLNDTLANDNFSGRWGDAWPHTIAVGDLNGDGYKDIAITAKSGIKIIAGRPKGSSTWVDAAATDISTLLDGTTDAYGIKGITFTGSDNFSREAFGNPGVLSGDARTQLFMGDVNNDGRNDLLVGYYMDNYGCGYMTGSISILFGVASGWNTTASNSIGASWFNGTNGVIYSGECIASWNQMGVDTAIGDVNGDGIKDILMGSRNSRPAIVFGRTTGWPTSRTNISTTYNDGTNGTLFSGPSGTSVGSNLGLGDMTGDGKADIIMGGCGPYAVCPSPGGVSQAGSIYIYYGKATGWTIPYDLTGL